MTADSLPITRRLPRLSLSRSAARKLGGSTRSLKGLLTVVIVVLVVTMPWTLTSFGLGVAVLIMQAVPGALALNMLQGVAGQISAGNAGFLAVGGLVVAILTHSASSVPGLVDVLIAGLVAALVGGIVGLPALRVRGLYLFVSTVALNFVIVYLFLIYQDHTVGDAGFSLPTFSVFGFGVDTPMRWFFTLTIFAVLALAAFQNIVRSRIGRALKAVRERELSAGPLGVNVARYKIEAFVATSFVIGIQGALFAYFTQVVTYDLFPFSLAVSYIAMVIIGGEGSALGSILGATFVIGVPYLVQLGMDSMPTSFPAYSTFQGHVFDLEDLLFGILIIVFIIYSPKGIVAIVSRIKKALVLWPVGTEPRGLNSVED